MRKFVFNLSATFLLTALTMVSFVFVNGTALASGGSNAAEPPRTINWPHAGPFGTYDRASMQRGLLVYREVCAGCHGLKYIAFRNLSEIGLSVAEIKAIAGEYTIVDGPNDEGENFERPGKPSDRFPSPFANDNAARASNNGALPPDLSLIVKARAHGEDYLYSLLTGYTDAPGGFKMNEDMNYNAFFGGRQIAMAAPLSKDAVEYPDGTPASVDQLARDVVNFLAWAAEPSLEDRKRMGVKVMIFLFLFACLMYAVKRKVWADVH